MSHQLTLELPDEVFDPLIQAARRAGQTVEQWATAQLRSCATPATNHAQDLTRLMAHAGAVDLGTPTGADNTRIDADLAPDHFGTN